MSRDVLIIGDQLMFIERSPNDVTAIPATDKPAFSLIAEADWLKLVGIPIEGETFEQLELNYIEKMGWKLAT